MPLSIPFGGIGLTLVSCCLTATVVGNAFYQKKQFYPSVVYITKSNPSMAAIYLIAFTLVILFGKMLKKIFFGTLRPAESEHLIERFFYAVTETCLAFTVFRDDFSPKFVALFTVLLFLKAFHWLADYRVDYMERSPVITRIFHIRVASLLILLSTIDILLVRYAYHSTMSVGASVQLVFGFEYAILLTVAYNIGVKYVCHGIDLQSENPWENKSMYLLYTELFVGFIKVLLYLAFLFIMIRIHTFPLFIIRPMYLTMKSFKKALQDILQSRRAIHNMNAHYPNATAEDLQESDNVCIICREEMLLNTGVKKLPCNHLFHAICLRSWFQRQQTCPTCRLDVLRQTPSRTATTVPPAAANPPPAEGGQPQGAANDNEQPVTAQLLTQQFMESATRFLAQQEQERRRQQNGGPPNEGPPPPPFMLPPLPPAMLQAMQRQAQSAPTVTSTTPSTSATSTASTSVSSTTSTASSSSTAPPLGNVGLPPGLPIPPFPPMMGMFPPPPPPPRDFGPFTLSELEEMEGRQRNHVIARLQALQNINVLISAATLQLTQYNSLMTTLDATMPLPPRNKTSQPAASTSSKTSSCSTSIAPTSSTSSTSTSSTQAPTSASPVTSISSPKVSSADSEGVTSNGLATEPPDEATISDVKASSSSPTDAGPSTGESGTAEEVRRRRLEHFAASNH